MRAHRFGVAIAAAALVLSACGGGTEASGGPEPTSPVTSGTSVQTVPAVEDSAPTTTQANASTATTSERPAPDPNRELAPDFTLALADGSTFVLSEETRPVFMVFWAEW